MSVLKKPVPFGKYYLLERINVGGMAEVFKAKTFGVEGFERLLAVKRILPNIAEDEEFITMFIDEAKIAVQLQHANIAQIFDLGKVEESYFIALEYVNGRDLRSIFDRMRSRGEALPIAMACWVMMQVCEGLDYAHNKRDGQGRELHLIHRDISPQNVLIGYDGEVKLIDFGIAKAAGKASTTQAGILKGKFGYMSPEQVRGLPIDKRSDIFAVGIVTYELLTGERLFVGETDFSTLEKVRNVEIVPPSSYNKKIPAELERLMLKALARDPEDRYSNAIDLHDDLQSFLYSIGEFYSRKDLSAWMKKTFAAEIEEDNAKIEQYRQIAPPVAASSEVSRRAAVGASARGSAPPAPPPAATQDKDKKKDKSGKDKNPSAMGWDDEELDTQIFDKTDENAEDKTVEQSATDLFFEDDDRTVANEPPPDILQQARPPEVLDTPKPQRRPGSVKVARDDIPGPTPPPVALPKPPAAPRRPTLTGVPPTVPRSTTRPLVAPLPPPPAPPPRMTPAQLRRSGLNLPPLHIPSPPAPVPAPPAPVPPPLMQMPPPPVMQMPAPMPPPRQNFRQPAPTTPFGVGNFSDELAQARGKKGGGAFLKVAVVLLLAAAGGGAYWYYAGTNKAGRIQVTMVPADATVLIDNAKVGDRSPLSIDRPPGPYTLSVTREGYERNDQNIEVRAGQPLPLTVTLEPSPDTGFELTSEPPGGMVWLDGAAIRGAAGQQARTDFRAFRIAPGHHLLEIKGENRFKPWRQDIDVQPGAIAKVHAMLIPASGSAPAGKTPPHAEVALAPPPPPPPPPPAPRAPPPPVQHEVVAPPPPPSSPLPGAPHTPRHKKAHEVALDDSGSVSPGSDDDSGAAAKAPDKGGDCTMTVNSVPWSEVWIDGKNTSQHTPIVDYKIPCGRHKLAFKRSDMQIDQTESINVKPGQNFKQRYTLATDE
jgi:eukaryotic-like serine/threonine-protein kinase